MKLVQIWNAREPLTRLAGLKKPPQVAYRLLKYSRKFEVELATCEDERSRLIYEISGAPSGESVALLPETADYATFVQRFNEFLAQESDLEPVGIDMDALIAALDVGGNTLSEMDLALLEVLFTEKQPLKLVSSKEG